jgi:hypothetical protein
VAICQLALKLKIKIKKLKKLLVTHADAGFAWERWD